MSMRQWCPDGLYQQLILWVLPSKHIQNLTDLTIAPVVPRKQATWPLWLLQSPLTGLSAPTTVREILLAQSQIMSLLCSEPCHSSHYTQKQNKTKQNKTKQSCNDLHSPCGLALGRFLISSPVAPCKGTLLQSHWLLCSPVTMINSCLYLLLCVRWLCVQMFSSQQGLSSSP